MLWSAFAAAVLAVVIGLAYLGDVVAHRELPDLRWPKARRFDRAYQRNRAARRPDLQGVRGRHEKR
jgi:hypothetical protein